MVKCIQGPSIEIQRMCWLPPSSPWSLVVVTVVIGLACVLLPWQLCPVGTLAHPPMAWSSAVTASSSPALSSTHAGRATRPQDSWLAIAPPMGPGQALRPTAQVSHCPSEWTWGYCKVHTIKRRMLFKMVCWFLKFIKKKGNRSLISWVCFLGTLRSFSMSHWDGWSYYEWSIRLGFVKQKGKK
jgi:hypothetical protein